MSLMILYDYFKKFLGRPKVEQFAHKYCTSSQCHDIDAGLKDGNISCELQFTLNNYNYTFSLLKLPTEVNFVSFL